jgi:hypothetical protein
MIISQARFFVEGPFTSEEGLEPIRIHSSPIHVAPIRFAGMLQEV